MPKCPYCKAEVYIEDFYEIIVKEKKSGEKKIKRGVFEGQILDDDISNRGWGNIKMWSCPFCDSILGFTEYRAAR